MVNPDSIRLSIHGQAFLPDAEPLVWTIAKYMVKSLFIAGHRNVILDATNVTKARRDEWISKAWQRKFVVFYTDREVCLERADNQGLRNAIVRMANQWEDPDSLECENILEA